MRTRVWLDQLATMALGAGLGYIVLSTLSAHAHVVAWILVLAGAIVRSAVLPTLHRQGQRGVS